MLILLSLVIMNVRGLVLALLTNGTGFIQRVGEYLLMSLRILLDMMVVS